MEPCVRKVKKQRAFRKRGQIVISMMVAVAAFCTTYALILPALTMSRQLVCGKQEHSHTETCYIQEETLTCGLTEGQIHTHGDECYTVTPVWICGLEEDTGHTHDETCYETRTVTVCGQDENEEHSHTEACVEQESSLICDREEMQPHTHTQACQGEDRVLTCEIPEAVPHVHDQRCYETLDVLVCTEEEHIHSEFCYDVGPSDPNADVETREDWEKSLSGVKLTGNKAENVIAVAMSQLGYQESIRNYVMVDDWNLNGYTRYGGWYGKPYDDWNAMFVSFVLHYAGVEDLGQAQDPCQWAADISEKLPQRYRTAGTYSAEAGDIAFLDQDGDGVIDDVGILAAVSENTWQVASGDVSDIVALVNYAPGDSRFSGFALIAEAADEAPREYTVTLAANNGTEETVQLRGKRIEIPSPDGFSPPDGMLFIQWNTEPDGSGTAYEDGEAVELTEDMTLYAQWAEDSFAWSGFAGSVYAASDPSVMKTLKQIEWTGTDTDDYAYRLHLALDGSKLSAGSVTTVQPKKRKIGILLDVTETMLSTWSGSSKGENKFDAVRDLLQGADGFLGSILDGSTEVSIILVGGQSGYGTYDQLSKQIAAGSSLGDFSNIDNSLHLAQGISYVTGLKAAEKYLGNDIDSLVYIVGNGPDTYIKYSDGTLERGTTGTQAQNKNYADYETFMENHPDLSMYMVGIAPVEHGADVAQKMGQYSVDRGTGGGYYEAGNDDQLKKDLEQIAQEIVEPADKVSGITITDALSGSVTLDRNVDLSARLILLNSDGTTKETRDISSNVSIQDGVLTCTYTGEIEGPFKIEIAFNIRTADGVYRDSSNPAYPNTGDADTDYGSNDTSSGKGGYYSNGEAKADYTLNGTEISSPFPKPVVQAPEKAVIQLKKVWVNAAADMQPVTVELRRGSPDGEIVGSATLNAENGWTASCDIRILTAAGTSNQIYIVEQTVDGFTTSYSLDNVTVAPGGSYTVTVTNTRDKKSASLTVTKKWQGTPGSQEAIIHVCVFDGVNTYEELEDSPFTVLSGEEISKTFTIAWAGETAPKIRVYEEQSSAFYPVFTGDGTGAIIPREGYQLSAQELTVKENGTYHVTLTNMASVTMPATGGHGTHMYVFGGLALIFGALSLMQIRKRKNEGRA